MTWAEARDAPERAMSAYSGVLGKSLPNQQGRRRRREDGYLSDYPHAKPSSAKQYRQKPHASYDNVPRQAVPTCTYIVALQTYSAHCIAPACNETPLILFERWVCQSRHVHVPDVPVAVSIGSPQRHDVQHHRISSTAIAISPTGQLHTLGYNTTLIVGRLDVSIRDHAFRSSFTDSPHAIQSVIAANLGHRT